MSEERLLTLEEVRLWLRVSAKTVLRLARDGRIPAFKVGAAWRFDRTALEEWVRGGREPGEGGDR